MEDHSPFVDREIFVVERQLSGSFKYFIDRKYGDSSTGESYGEPEYICNFVPSAKIRLVQVVYAIRLEK